ncbi:fragile X mental retardation 1 neighbor protein isoform X2 [Apteryx rowi]|uniref:fragile X mental retardation 1 neighbor protein isoform X2 n=1 Tax=Apteryx rowi TaxID=308060 RepID=UPI000E1DFAE3|nr:fragile X mental retardation 1 neighbor protein isoform X2 [Apteryx rowi]XP_025935835.1 fragile X mental retardation 1 neighbor protein isoform X2 [Apteryx rowi]XP_025935844.1 fragile X mental retardation 1 neighbor protein isoform X2 [Apteryx rowi]XP_025935852.1 fragile X mental retardation 1 neighbor protein isoform X2 [Apteryx rowi]XP_025935862.1 fragile X mental retardation 1 neighbor protein isoform X2 [Apteryx rowi]XP_025935871.1 fragile X mental retardation 1 neighbor protein isoform
MLQGVTGTHLLWNCVILMMFHSIGSSFASPTQHVLEKSEVAPSKFKVKLKDASEALVNFFAPMTCRHKDKQALIPCRVGENINTTECLENKCCPSKTSHELKCYTPFKDNLQLTFRLFVLGAGGFFILGCLPFCCCACLRRRYAGYMKVFLKEEFLKHSLEEEIESCMENMCWLVQVKEMNLMIRPLGLSENKIRAETGWAVQNFQGIQVM